MTSPAPAPLPCATKATHTSRRNAGHALRAMRARDPRTAKHLRIDQCLHCGAWHLFKTNPDTPEATP